MAWRCGNIEVDEQAREFRRDGLRIHLERKVFELLVYLVCHRDRVVSKQELFDAIWTGTVVGEAALTRCVYLARKALGTAELIKVVHGRGYRFVGTVVEGSASSDLMRTIGAVAERVRGGGARGVRPSASSASSSSIVRGGAVFVFVGRARELAVAEERLAHAVAGRGGACLVHGEAGIGKSRLLLELAAGASECGAWAARGESLDAQGAPAYWPWLQVLRKLARATREVAGEGRALEAASAELVQVAGVLAVDEGEGGAPAGNRLLFFERIAEVLDRIARVQPIAVLLDDLHHADLPSLHLFTFLARALASSRVLLLGAHRTGDLARDAERSAALTPVLNGETSSIELSGLSADEIEGLLRSRVESSRLDEVARSLHARTAGNPFFLTQLMPLVADDGFRFDSGQLPRGVRDVVHRRLDELGPDCAEVLRVASVFGTRFEGSWIGTWRHAGDRVLDGFERAISANLLRQVSDAPATFEFVHGLIRDALYEELGVSRRAALHADAAAFFETCVDLDEERRLAALAHHYGRALPLGDPELALSCAIQAGTLAQARYAYEMASDYFAQALRILESGTAGDEEQYFAVLLDLGHAQTHAGRRDAARATLDRATALARRLGSADGLARVALRIAPTFSVIELVADEDEARLLEEALAGLGAEEKQLCGLLKARLAAAQAATKTWPERVALLEDAERLIDDSSSDATKARILCSRLAALWRPDNLKDRIAWTESALQPCLRAGDYGLLAGIHVFRIALALERGDLAAARVAAGALAQAGIDYHQPMFLAEGCRGVLAFVEGRLAEAEHFCAAMLQSAERTKLHGPLQGFGALFSLIRIERGSAGEVLEMLRYFGDQYKEMPGWRALLAYALSKAGENHDARREFDRLAELDFPIPEDPTWLGCMAMLSEVCADLGDSRRGAALHERLAPFADRHAMAGQGALSLGSMQRFLGLLSAVCGEQSAARAHFEAAIESNTGAGALLALAYTQHDYAELLRNPRDQGDRDRSLQLKESALQGARQCGCVHLERRIERARRAPEAG